jgi:hypothetical protein
VAKQIIDNHRQVFINNGDLYQLMNIQPIRGKHESINQRKGVKLCCEGQGVKKSAYPRRSGERPRDEGIKG